jgi:hypothetical protein
VPGAARPVRCRVQLLAGDAAGRRGQLARRCGGSGMSGTEHDYRPDHSGFCLAAWCQQPEALCTGRKALPVAASANGHGAAPARLASVAAATPIRGRSPAVTTGPADEAFMSLVDDQEMPGHADGRGGRAAGGEVGDRILSHLIAAGPTGQARAGLDFGPGSSPALGALVRAGLVESVGGGRFIATGAGDEQDEIELDEVPPFPHGMARGPLRDLLDWADADGLPVSFMGAAAETVAAAAAARTVNGKPGAVLLLGAERRVIPSLWQVLIGESGDGKNPPIRQARRVTDDVQAGRVAAWQAQCEIAAADDKPSRPVPLSVTSTTIESQARWLMATGGAGLAVNGELASWLRSLGQYKAGGGSDRYDAMDIWSGEPVYQLRVGDGGKRNAVTIDIPEPRLSVLGGLVADNLPLLGSDGDGLRARFLPVLPSSPVRPNIDGSAPLPASWVAALRSLHDQETSRTWYLRGDAREAVKDAAAGWAERKRDGTDPKVIRTALAKADEQCMRLALVVAEISDPGRGGDIPVWAVHYAITRVEYALGCWAALGSDNSMTYSRRDEVLSRGVMELQRRIEARPVPECGRRFMTRHDIQRAAVAGARTPGQVDELLRAYGAELPGCLSVYSEADRAKFPGARLADRSAHPALPARGAAGLVAWAPRRGSAGSPSASGKLSALTISPPCGGPGTSGVFAGQGLAGGSRGQQIIVSNASADNNLLTITGEVEPAGGSGVHNDPVTIPGPREVRCPACGWRFATAQQPGEPASCGQCGQTFTVLGK